MHWRGYRIQRKPFHSVELVRLAVFNFVPVNQHLEVECDPVGSLAVVFPVNVTVAQELARQAAHARVVVSRGTGIASSDQVWLADAGSVELPGTRVGPFACGSGESQTRADCSIASFGAWQRAQPVAAR